MYNNNNSYYNKPNHHQHHGSHGGYDKMNQNNNANINGPPNDHSLYIGDLTPEVTDSILGQAFQSRYPSFRNARVINDATTGLPKGYGFVKFNSEIDKERAMVEMQGHVLCGRPIKLNVPTYKRYNIQNSTSTIPDLTLTDPHNTCIYVSQLDPMINEEVLGTIFSAYGEITYIKMLANRLSAFINFVHRQSAEAAFGINNQLIYNSRLKIQWGKNGLTPGVAVVQPSNILPPQLISPSQAMANIIHSPVLNNQPQQPLSTQQQQLLQQQQKLQQQQYQNFNPNMSPVNSLNTPPQPSSPAMQQQLHHQNQRYSFISKEKEDITKAYNITKDNKLFISWNRDTFENNYFSRNSFFKEPQIALYNNDFTGFEGPKTIE
ncbi:hypothetical protein CYY_005096 [Polysphondylium violaceum]|uniref:RRM domain-containing protein n=1 Tax=Polysphondylium violaceum TaxID=133409 RepID=A0A8J4V4J7_9MYCE|nr:hypothetical protein CYY_005096 [Polysphondylium violaceum]